MKFVLVPGGWQGGWVFDALAADLRQAGHEVEAVTLSGLEQDTPADFASAPNLDTHINQVADLIATSDDARLVLCGHSYAGLVIAGVAASGGPWPGTPFGPLTDRLRNDPAWTFHEIPVGHNIARRDPHALAAVLAALPPSVS
ncbi:alpha/beta fold hydrolase [Kribbella sp. DT2]|uniref:alpha/beta fold hydrolase n=1 Tax=Kribbella sp. DT2 TaxID=3393427 RepID=UPI003CF5500E